jgi:hypothetical protein
MPKLDDQISTLQQRLQQLKLRQQRSDARKRAIAATRDRKADTRRKILLGGLVLEKIRQGEMNKDQVSAWLDHALARAADRALFALPARPSAAGSAAAESAVAEAASAEPPSAEPSAAGSATAESA